MTEIAVRMEALNTRILIIHNRVLLALAANAILFGLCSFLSISGGLTQKGHVFLVLLVGLLIFFLTELVLLPMVMAVSSISLIVFGIGETRQVWVGYAHPVVFFALGCLIMAVAAEATALFKRLGRFITRNTGTVIVRFSFIFLLRIRGCLVSDVR